MKISKVKLAWAAGFVEGEGYITVGRVWGHLNRYRYYYFRMNVTQTERVQLEQLQKMFSGSISTKGKDKTHHKTAWCWNISGEPAVAAYRAMEPYFVGNHRRKQFQNAMTQLEGEARIRVDEAA